MTPSRLVSRHAPLAPPVALVVFTRRTRTLGTLVTSCQILVLRMILHTSPILTTILTWTPPWPPSPRLPLRNRGDPPQVPLWILAFVSRTPSLHNSLPMIVVPGLASAMTPDDSFSAVALPLAWVVSPLSIAASSWRTMSHPLQHTRLFRTNAPPPPRPATLHRLTRRRSWPC